MGMMQSIIKLILWVIKAPFLLPIAIFNKIFTRHRLTHVTRDWKKQQKPTCTIKQTNTQPEATKTEKTQFQSTHAQSDGEKQQKPTYTIKHINIQEAIRAKIQRQSALLHNWETPQLTHTAKQTNTQPEATKTEETQFQSAADWLTTNLKSEKSRNTWQFDVESALGTKKITAFLRIEYIDRDGQKTIRDVDVQTFNDHEYGGILAGFCHLRGAFRSFRYDRIQSCTDLKTGEVIEDIKKYLNNQYKETPDWLENHIIMEYIDNMKILYYVAKADGACRKKEKQIITQYIQEVTNNQMVTLDMTNEILQKIGTVNWQTFECSINNVKQQKQIDISQLLLYCQTIAATQKRKRHNTQTIMNYISQQLKQ
jgi:hypothetical protein